MAPLDRPAAALPTKVAIELDMNARGELSAATLSGNCKLPPWPPRARPAMEASERSDHGGGAFFTCSSCSLALVLLRVSLHAPPERVFLAAGSGELRLPCDGLLLFSTERVRLPPEELDPDEEPEPPIWLLRLRPMVAVAIVRFAHSRHDHSTRADFYHFFDL